MNLPLYACVVLLLLVAGCRGGSSGDGDSGSCDGTLCRGDCLAAGHVDGYCAEGSCRCVPRDDDDDWTPPPPCGGSCDRREYTACTCGEADPCGWYGDGVCDLDRCLDFDVYIFDDTVDCDDDGDGFAQIFEFWLADLFTPVLVFAEGEDDSGRRTHWAVHPLGEDQFSIFYALSYYKDAGDPWAEMFTWHHGDTEFIVLEITLTDESVIFEEAFLSAHFGQGSWDSSEWVLSDEFEYDDSDGGLHPYVWVAEGKHANYRSYSVCDAGALGADRCSSGDVEYVEVDSARNLGNDVYPLIDEVVFRGASEFYWSHRSLPFCGWRVDSLESYDRTNCAGVSNTYARELGAWLDGEL